MKINKQAVADKVKVIVPENTDVAKHEENISKLNVLCVIFPELKSLEMYYNYKAEMWFVGWELFGAGEFIAKAAAVARMTTWLNEWAKGDIEECQ